MAPEPWPACNSVRPPPAERPLVVLVVDDNQDVADSLALLVRLWGHEASVAYDGPAALQAAQDRPPDVLVLDLALPAMDGLRLARMVRQLPESRGCVLVALTGYADRDHQRQCEEAGFDYFLAKAGDPEDVERLLRLVARAKAIPDQAGEVTLKGGETLRIVSSPA